MIDTRQSYAATEPGELAYLAYWRARAPLALPWDQLTVCEQRAWRAATAAVQRGRLRLCRPLSASREED